MIIILKELSTASKHALEVDNSIQCVFLAHTCSNVYCTSMRLTPVFQIIHTQFMHNGHCIYKTMVFLFIYSDFRFEY